ncbi:MAG TPA: DR2241 family protein [Longimicrobiaceae bacterium]|nr:DR2241 family protein [Longimicrobiaceae bacterium]
MSDAAEQRGTHAPAGVAEARAALLAWVAGAGAEGRVFLQVLLRAGGDGRYELRHARDAALPLDALAVGSDPFSAREVAQVTDAGEHRPLKTAPNLRGGWALAGLDGRGLWTALDYLYPACAVHWHAGRTGTLRPTHWRETAGRQSGIYSPVKLLAEGAVRNAVRACCGDAVCLRRVAWGIDSETPLELADEGPPAGDAAVPCPEACSVFVAFARKVLTLERAPRREVPGLVPMSAAELLQLREVVAAAAAGTLGSVREGEFDEPANPRRIRYLAARLAEAAAEPAADAGLPCEGCPRPEPCAGCPLAAA